MQRQVTSAIAQLPADFEKPCPQSEAGLQAERSQKMEALGRLVSSVAHDFNNLLTGIRLYSDLLSATLNRTDLESSNPERDKRLQQYAEEIRKATDHGSALTQQLMSFVLEQVAKPELLSLNDAILEFRNLLERLIGENIQLVTELASDLEPVKMNGAQVQQLILNLVLNARDAMPNGGRITMATRNYSEYMVDSNDLKVIERGFLEFSVADTGSGMDSKTRARIFEPFYTTKPPGKGSGLGLATVRKIVTQHGGTIQVESELGKGTRIIIHLPRFAFDLPAEAAQPREFPHQNDSHEFDQ
ncbi:MAG TPA: ATP-binding protein [Terriglobales bacterium]|nr:ATP-binding protein [Terriglobales bacterium]